MGKKSKLFEENKRQREVSSVGKKALESRVSPFFLIPTHHLPLSLPTITQTATILPLFHLDGLLIFNGYNFQHRKSFISSNILRGALLFHLPSPFQPPPWSTTSPSSYKMIK